MQSVRLFVCYNGTQGALFVAYKNLTQSALLFATKKGPLPPPISKIQWEIGKRKVSGFWCQQWHQPVDPIKFGSSRLPSYLCTCYPPDGYSSLIRYGPDGLWVQRLPMLSWRSGGRHFKFFFLFIVVHFWWYLWCYVVLFSCWRIEINNRKNF